MKRYSKFGLSAVGIYLLFVVALWIYAAQCTGNFCELSFILVGLPWILIPGMLDSVGYYGLEWLSTSSHYNEFLWGTVLLNIIILYFLFASIEKKVGNQK